MQGYVAVFLHLFGKRPSELTYDEWRNCRSFADDWIKSQSEGGS